MQESRLLPRYPFTQPVELCGPDGARFDARSCDISPNGIGLTLSRNVVVSLAQGGAILTTGDRFQLVLPEATDSSSRFGLLLTCRVRHVRRLSREQYQVGGWFVDTTPDQESAIAGLLESAKPQVFR